MSYSNNVWGLFLLKIVQELLQRMLIIRKKEGKASALTALISPVLGPHGVFGSTSTSHSRPLSSPSPIPESLREIHKPKINISIPLLQNQSQLTGHVSREQADL